MMGDFHTSTTGNTFHSVTLGEKKDLLKRRVRALMWKIKYLTGLIVCLVVSRTNGFEKHNISGARLFTILYVSDKIEISRCFIRVCSKYYSEGWGHLKLIHNNLRSLEVNYQPLLTWIQACFKCFYLFT